MPGRSHFSGLTPTGGGYRHLFGPVRSRRMGLSLGVDLVPFKTCAFDCVFCQLGTTTALTLERREYVPVEAVLAELDGWLAGGGRADYVTLAGSGEPTLHVGFGRVLDGIGDRAAIRRALLSNGALFFLPEVRSDAAKAEVVKVSLSAWDQASFAAVNRPHSELRFELVVDGLRRFRCEYSGELWVETMLVGGLNDGPEAVDRIAALVTELAPDKVQLNTVVRPPAFSEAQAVAKERLTELANRFRPAAEVIGEADRLSEEAGEGAPSWNDAERLMRRHPCTVRDVASFLELPEKEAEALLAEAVRQGRIRPQPVADQVYYSAADASTVTGDEDSRAPSRDR